MITLLNLVAQCQWLWWLAVVALAGSLTGWMALDVWPEGRKRR